MFCASLKISTQAVRLQWACKEEMVQIHFIIPEYFSKVFLENKLIAFHCRFALYLSNATWYYNNFLHHCNAWALYFLFALKMRFLIFNLFDTFSRDGSHFIEAFSVHVIYFTLLKLYNSFISLHCINVY